MAATPADALPPGTEHAFALMRERFRTGLPERWRAIAGASDVSGRQAGLHRLAGAAGSFGFADLGQAARRAEDAAQEDGPDAGAALAALQCIIDALCEPGVPGPGSRSP